MRGGGMLLDNHCVTDIVPGDRVIVRTNKGDFISRKVVITAGAWAPKLISKLGMQLPIKVLTELVSPKALILFTLNVP